MSAKITITGPAESLSKINNLIVSYLEHPNTFADYSIQVSTEGLEPPFELELPFKIAGIEELKKRNER